MIKLSVTEISAFLGGTLEGKQRDWIQGISKIDQGQPDTLTFLANPKYAEHLHTTEADVILINIDQEIDINSSKTFIRVEDAYLAFCQVLNQYYNPAQQMVGVHPTAVISDNAVLGKDIFIGANAFIGNGAQLEDGTKIYPNCFVGDNCKVGSGTILYANVSIYHDCSVGSNSIIHSGTVIGSDGFGHAPKKDGSYIKIPQVGNAIVGDDVEIGANCTIDRATLGSTIIGDGVKLDNLIQVAHNVEIGANTVIAAQTGISGSTTLGERCMIGGQVGFAGHLKIANGTQVGAQSGLNKSIEEENSRQFGSPVMPLKDALKSYILVRQLPEIDDRIKILEKTIAQLKAKLGEN